jgi:hypothetical protein
MTNENAGDEVGFEVIIGTQRARLPSGRPLGEDGDGAPEQVRPVAREVSLARSMRSAVPSPT